MKIAYALFENFCAVEAGMGRTKIEIDFTNLNEVITMLIGPMGSGKTTILSHLQPYPHVGTLDKRNSNSIIIEGVNGKKLLKYDVDGTEYTITHNYTWNKTTHNVKSYITKNDTELNPNGNQESFREIVETELGFTADLLRLIRLGPNVANLIDLSTVERKDYVARMLKDLDIHLMISKDMKERVRTITAQTQLLAKKLNGLSDDMIDDMKTRLLKLSKKLKDRQMDIDASTSVINTIIAELQIYLGGRTVKEFESKMQFLDSDGAVIERQINDTRYKIDDLNTNFGSLNDITRRLGKCDADYINNKRLISAVTLDIEDKDTRRAELEKLVRSVATDGYVNQLRSQYNEYGQEIVDLKNFTNGFECPYNSSEINAILNDIQIIETDMSTVLEEDPSTVQIIVKASSNIVEYSKKQVGILQAKQFKLQKSLSNYKYVNEYDVGEELSLPKTCKDFTNCPYFYTHPNTVKMNTSSNEFFEKFNAINGEIAVINAKIEQYLLYPSIYKRIANIRKAFDPLAKRLSKINALTVSSLDKILSSQVHRYWYDNDQIVDTLELCVKKEKLAMMETKAYELKAELDKLSGIDSDTIRDEYRKVLESIEASKRTIQELDEANISIKSEEKSLNAAYESLLGIEELKSKLRDLEDTRDNLDKEMSDMNQKYDIVCGHKERLKSAQDKLRDLQLDYDTLKSEYDATQINLATIESYRADYESLTQQLYVLDLIQGAASSKNGIPLEHVKIFLDDCIEDINDMVSSVFDDLEVCNFNISEKDFKIPYVKNGKVIEDISSASQGERAIISVALSFSLMLKSSTNYNIPLLDEIDASVHAVDREKILLILSRFFQRINAEQAFIITHNSIFEGYPVNIICTADEHLDNKQPNVIKLT